MKIEILDTLERKDNVLEIICKVNHFIFVIPYNKDTYKTEKIQWRQTGSEWFIVENESDDGFILSQTILNYIKTF